MGIKFRWEGYHNVLIHPSGNCDTTDAVLIQEGEDASGTYVVQEKDIGVMTFACDTKKHCQLGQIINITVLEPPTASPTVATVPIESDGIAADLTSSSFSFNSFITAMVATAAVLSTISLL